MQYFQQKKSLLEREASVLLPTYNRSLLEIDRGSGAYLLSTNGKVYLDFFGGIAVNALGHAHPKIVEAVSRQIARYGHVSNVFVTREQVELAESIREATGFERVFFTNSGTEANEAVIKLVRKWGSSRMKSELIGATGGFHGRTMGALSIMTKESYREGFGPFLPDCLHIIYNDVDSLRKAVTPKTAGVFIEAIQGEGGLAELSPEFTHELEELHSRFGFLLVADEIQSGVGRTGKFFGYEHFGLKPDVVTLAKAIGGGLPLGAVLVREELANVLPRGSHGTTFGGNPVACAAGKVVLDELKNGLQENVLKVGKYLYEQLEILRKDKPDVIKEIRGKGLMVGIVLTAADGNPVVQKLFEHGVLVNCTAGNVLRLLPPLNITEVQVDEFVKALRLVV